MRGDIGNVAVVSPSPRARSRPRGTRAAARRPESPGLPRRGPSGPRRRGPRDLRPGELDRVAFAGSTIAPEKRPAGGGIDSHHRWNGERLGEQHRIVGGRRARRAARPHAGRSRTGAAGRAGRRRRAALRAPRRGRRRQGLARSRGPRARASSRGRRPSPPWRARSLEDRRSCRWRARTSQCPRVPLPPSGTGTAIARPASEPCSITNIACRPASARSLTSAWMSDAARREKPRSCGWRASSTPPDRRKHPPPRDRFGDRA